MKSIGGMGVGKIKLILVVSIMSLAWGQVSAVDIASCSSPKGFSYYTEPGLMPECASKVLFLALR